MTNRNLVVEPVEIMDREVERLKQSRIPIVIVRWNSQILSSFHQVNFRDQHKLNFGTKFLLEGKTVTTHNFRSFFRSSTYYYSSITIHQSLFIIFGVSLRFREAYRKFTIHKALFISEEKILFMYFIQFIVNLVYGYSNSRNQSG